MSEVIDRPQVSSAWSWIVVFSAALFFFYEFMQLNMFNAINPALSKEFNVSAASLGQLSAFYFYANMLFLFPAGMILDRVSTYRVILIAMSLAVISTFVFATTSHFNIAALCRFFTGLGSSFCFLSCIRLASRWFPSKQMALVIGLVVTMAMMGGVVAQSPFTWLTDNLGWRLTLILDGSAGVLFIVVIAFLVRDYPQGYVAVGKQTISLNHFWSNIWLTATNLQNWLGGLYTSLLNLPIFILGAMWGSSYLVQIRGLSRIDASSVITMIFVGTIIGSPTLGWLSDRIRLRRLPMIVCAILSLAVILAIMYLPQLSFSSLIMLFLLLGFFTSAQIISYPLIAESNPHKLVGAAEGLASVLIMAGGISQPLFGWLIQIYWDHTLVNQLPVYSNANYLLGMAIMPIGCALGLVAALLLRETHCNTQG